MNQWTPEGPFLGFLPQIITDLDPRPVREQIADRYAHGGGWNPFKGFDLRSPATNARLEYPGDPPMRELSRTQIRDETVIFFEYSWVAVVQPTGEWEVVRMD